MTITTQTPGKLILIGEYAVLEGAPALVTAINKYAKISVQNSIDSHFVFNAPNLNIDKLKFKFSKKKIIFNKKINSTEQEHLHLFNSIMLFIYNYLGTVHKTVEPLEISIDTGDFYTKESNKKIGLGSSAALTVGLIKSVFQFYNYTLTNNELFKLGVQSHYEAQNKSGSGIDIVASTYAATGVFNRKNDSHQFKKIRLPNDLYVIPVWTGSSTSTPKFIAKTKQLKSSNPETYNNLIKKLSELSSEGIHCIETNELVCFFEIVDDFYNALYDLGLNSGIPIISDIHIEIADLVKKCGGFYKPSGAGGSDIGIAFTNDLKIKNNIIEKIKNSSFKYIKLNSIG